MFNYYLFRDLICLCFALYNRFVCVCVCVCVGVCTLGSLFWISALYVSCVVVLEASFGGLGLGLVLGHWVLGLGLGLELKGLVNCCRGQTEARKFDPKNHSFVPPFSLQLRPTSKKRNTFFLSLIFFHSLFLQCLCSFRIASIILLSRAIIRISTIWQLVTERT